MEFLRFLRNESGAYGTRIAVVTLLGGLAAGLMMIIIFAAAATATDAATNFQYLILFGLLLLAILLAKRYSLNHTTRLTEGVVERLRVRISDKIRRAELLYFENTGSTHFATILTKETQLISSTATQTINAAASAVMLGVAFLFIAVLSLSAFLVTLAAVAVALYTYRRSVKKVEAQMQETTRVENGFFDLLHHLLAGFKELKMDARKNRDFFDHDLLPQSARVRALKITTSEHFVDATIVVHAAFYVLVAIVIFLLPKLADCDLGVIMQVAAVILYILGPLAEVVGVVPQIVRASVSVRTIEELERSLDAEAAKSAFDDYAHPPRPWSFREIEVRDLRFTYPDPDGAPGYSVGPLNLKFAAGEILFIVGGNGSGKSTFLKLLVGLYSPQAGEILVDGEPLKPAQRQRYRSLFSVVFTDFHLFDRLYGMERIDDEQLEALIAEMELEDKTRIVEGRFTHLNLSTGQRKRLALIVCLLEQKQAFVFDEWAADQDPAFRRHFYEDILPELKKQGKTIIAATHDDRFFHVADRVIKMEYGRFATELATEATS